MENERSNTVSDLNNPGILRETDKEPNEKSLNEEGGRSDGGRGGEAMTLSGRGEGAGKLGQKRKTHAQTKI